MRFNTAHFVLYSDESTPEERGIRGVANVYRVTIDHDVSGAFAGLEFEGVETTTRLECTVQGLEVWGEVLSPEAFQRIDFLSDELQLGGFAEASAVRVIRIEPGFVVEVFVWGPCERVIVSVLKDPIPAGVAAARVKPKALA